MQTMLVRERYKVVRAPEVRENYAFLETVDIRDRDKTACLLNVYEGELLPVYLNIFDRLQDCPEFRGAFIAESSLAAAFDHHDGLRIDQVFYRGAAVDRAVRYAFAEALLHRALTMANYPPEISCAAMLSENLLVDLQEQRLRTCWKILPMEGMNARELVFLTVDQLKKILLHRFETPLAELEFLRQAEQGSCRTVVQLYSLWREQRPILEEAWLAQEKKGFVGRFFSNLLKEIKWRWKQRKRGEGL